MPVPAVDLTNTAFTIPGDTASQLYGVVTRLDNDDLTTGAIGGTGAFDALMTGLAAHLRGEYDAGRITGAEYTKAYIALTQAAMANATQFLLAREQAFWQSVQGQIGAVTAKVSHETAKVQYDSAKYQLDTQMPLQTAGLTLDNAGKTLDNAGKTTANSIAAYTLSTMLPQQVAKLTADIAAQNAQVANLTYTLTYLLPKQVTLVTEQGEVQRAQTLDARSDGATVVGLTGKQKELYGQQITSYKRDIEVKSAKLFTDAWITMKTLDEGLAAPGNFSNASLDEVLNTIKTNVPL